MRRIFTSSGLVLALIALGCRSSAPDPGPPVALHYVGSSTVAQFLRMADEVYRPAIFTLDTAPESDGGERAILDGHADLAGIAREPGPEVADTGVRATLIGRDAIAVVAHPDLEFDGLTRAQLARVFGGEVERWSELGGPDLPVLAFTVAPGSATRRVFRHAVLGEAELKGVEEISPDGRLLEVVAQTPGAIGTISHAFLREDSGVRELAVDGVLPGGAHFDYPITRPLYLLWREQLNAVEDFVAWAQGDVGQGVLMQRFVGTGVITAVGAEPTGTAKGTLVVLTPREEVYDGGIYYHPYRAYELRTRYGELIRVVPNRVGNNDQRPMRVDLDPGVYLVRAPAERGTVDFFATVQAGRTTEIDVLALVEERR